MFCSLSPPLNTNEARTRLARLATCTRLITSPCCACVCACANRYTLLPVMHLVPVRDRPVTMSHVYRCPVYKILSRQGECWVTPDCVYGARMWAVVVGHCGALFHDIMFVWAVNAVLSLPS